VKRRNVLLFQHGRGQATQAMEDSSLSLFGKFFMTNSLNRRAARDVLGKVWRIGSEFKAMEVGNNIFHF
jgi:hypothetical protein